MNTLTIVSERAEQLLDLLDCFWVEHADTLSIRDPSVFPARTGMVAAALTLAEALHQQRIPCTPACREVLVDIAADWRRIAAEEADPADAASSRRRAVWADEAITAINAALAAETTPAVVALGTDERRELGELAALRASAACGDADAFGDSPERVLRSIAEIRRAGILLEHVQRGELGHDPDVHRGLVELRDDAAENVDRARGEGHRDDIATAEATLDRVAHLLTRVELLGPAPGPYDSHAATVAVSEDESEPLIMALESEIEVVMGLQDAAFESRMALILRVLLGARGGQLPADPEAAALVKEMGDLWRETDGWQQDAWTRNRVAELDHLHLLITLPRIGAGS